jgi:beta-1,4-mannosyl-glycoprotein beta-1,4-N-acetylglucosaminyltransferase
MKIIDTFIFYNEIELLYYRLSILDQYVDKFILVESTHTFTGNKKPLYYAENIEIFRRFNDKIIHIIVEDIPYKFPDINYNANQQWENEYHQRNSIKRGIDSILHTLENTDIILTSDVDEIPNPNILMNAQNGSLIYDRHTLNRLALDMYYYNLYYRIGEGSNWHGVKLMTIKAYNTINLTFQQMRLYEHSHHVPVVEKGGWHLSYFGDINFIIKKVASFSHQEYNNDKFLNKESLEKKMKAGINLLNNSELHYIPIESNSNLPYQYNIYLKNYI